MRRRNPTMLCEWLSTSLHIANPPNWEMSKNVPRRRFALWTVECRRGRSGHHVNPQPVGSKLDQRTAAAYAFVVLSKDLNGAEKHALSCGMFNLAWMRVV